MPESQVPGDMTSEVAEKLIDQKMNGSDALGKDPKTGLPIYVLSGRYGPYVQMGENESDQLKRMAVPANLEPEKVTLQQALSLLELPKSLGRHPASGKDVKKGLGRFGPYVVHDGDYRSIPKTENIFDVSLDRALELLAQPKKSRGRAMPLKELGVWPDTEDMVQVFSGKYGPYLKVGSKNVSLGDDIKIDSLTLDEVRPLLEEKLSKAKGAGRGAKSKAKSRAKTASSEKESKATSSPAKPATSKVVLKKANKSANV